jgi:hypothetical protein
MSLFALGRALLLRGPLRASALALCLAATVAVAWALPLTESVALRSGLREALAGGAALTVEQPEVGDFDGFVAFQRRAEARVDARLRPYLQPGTVLATVGPLPAVSVNDQPVEGAGLRVTAAYLDDLAAHVEVLAGALPPDGLGGPLPAVTMPETGADQLGLRLGDRFCVELSPGAPAPTWCARVVALWRPLRATDPYWGGSPPRLTAAMGAYDLFELLKLKPAGGALAGRRYAADLAAIGPAGAGDLARRLRDLRDSFAGDEPMRLDLSLDAALGRYDAAQGPTALTLNVLMSALAVLALCLVQLTASRVADLQARDVALLRARGWPPGPAWRFLFGQLCAVGVLALPVGLAGAAVATAALAVGAASAGPTAGDLALAAGTLAAVLASAVAVLAVVAWSVAARAPGEEPSALGPAGAWWRRWNVDLPLAGLALALVLARPAQPGGLPGATAVGDALRFVAPVLAVAILGLVALRALPLAGRLAGLGRAGLPSSLAGWQLRRRPDQHAGLVFILVLALATAGFCALGLAAEPLPAAGLGAIHAARQAMLVAVLLAVLTMGWAGSWLHFTAAARSRRREYAALALNGLPAAAARHSLGIEQAVVLAYGVGVGTLLALTQAAALLADVSRGGVELSSGDLLSAGLAWAALPAGLVVVGWLVRRRSFRGDLLEELRRA